MHSCVVSTVGVCLPMSQCVVLMCVLVLNVCARGDGVASQDTDARRLRLHSPFFFFFTTV